MTLSAWREALAETLPRVQAWRRELHAHPELSGQEFATRDRIAGWLKELGIPVTFFEGCCGVMGVMENGPGRCVAIRADMDALPIREPEGLPFASENPGVMHACGHDVHMALALGSALYLSTHRELWQGTVKWLFEPQEETEGGAKWMVEQGCMESPSVDVVIGQHVNPRYPVGVFYCKPGFVSGASDEVRLTVRGRSCHGAYPESGVDAIVIAAQLISALQSLVSRERSPFDPVALTFGTIRGGSARNIVCDEVSLDGTLRTLSPDTRTEMHRRLRETCEGIAHSLRGEAELTIVPGYGAVYNDDTAYRAVEDAAREILGEGGIVLRPNASLGVESFCYFEDHTPGVYYDIGSGLSTALHTPTLMIDEGVLETGLALQCASVLALLSQSK
ncbi:MAG: amidohydrolase [Clostridia bacterium]|nr:amidohydrolase [Clostridia bacterium]